MEPAALGMLVLHHCAHVNDTIVGSSDSPQGWQPHPDFLQILNRSATLIQIWYRYQKWRRKRRVELSKEASAEDFKRSIVMIKSELQNLANTAGSTIGGDVTADVEEAIRKRREERARAARLEVIKEMKEKRILNSSVETLVDAQHDAEAFEPSHPKLAGSSSPMLVPESNDTAGAVVGHFEERQQSYTSLDDLTVVEERSVSANDDPTAQRIDRILDYLKHVEDDDAKSAATMRGGASTTVMGDFAKDSYAPLSTSGTITGPNTTAVFDGVKAKIMGQQLEIEEKSRTLALLKKELKKLKEANKEQAIQYKKDLKSKLAMQRKEYETIIKRHLTFIDKLLAEKEDLSKKCEVLSEEVKTIEKQFKDKSRILEEQHVRDLKQQREMWQAAEKIKRDKWIQEKTKAIKDQTVKGLEPEIQRMLAQQKLQIRQMEEKFREELIREKGILIEQGQRQMETMRDRIVAERQRACEEEREFARQRYQKQLERDEMEFQQNKRKLVAEFEEQKHALIESMKQEKKADEMSHRKAVDDLKRQIEAEKDAKETALEEVRRKHLTELSNLREKLSIEKEEWQTHFMAKQEAEMRQREKLFKEKLIKERDAEIEMVIQRLESETSSTSSDATRRYRMEVEKLKAEMAEEVKQLRDQHSLALDKVLAAQTALAHSEEQRRELQKENMQVQHECLSKDNLIRQQKNELMRLKVDEQTLSNTIHLEFEEQLANKDAALRTLADQVAAHEEQLEIMSRKFRHEMDEVVNEKDEAMRLIDERVRKTVALKDEIISSLRTQVEDLSIRNTHLERLIEKQRQELLS
ncbi:Centrosomal protein of 131 kDa [Borealophlyctis nickersoniae]|nr:Centrosomal protein of 131 kDa [Borealophlyctis nickersoniae]